MDSSLKQTTLKNDNNHLGSASAIITDSYQYGYIIYLNFRMSYISTVLKVESKISQEF